MEKRKKENKGIEGGVLEERKERAKNLRERKKKQRIREVEIKEEMKKV